MKKFILILIAFISIVHIHAQNQSTQSSREADSLANVTCELLRFEAMYRNQSWVMPRSSLAHPFTFGQQMKRLFKEGVEFTDAYVCNNSGDEAEDTTYMSPGDLLSIDPITLAYTVTDSCLIAKNNNANISINLGYKDNEGIKKYFTFYMRTLANNNPSTYVRMTYMIPFSGEDDKQNYQTKSNPIVGSYVTAFDTRDTTAFMALFDSVYTSYCKKIKEGRTADVNQQELNIYLGHFHQDQSAFSSSYAKSLYDDHRYYDSFVRCKKMYFDERDDATKGDKEAKSRFYDICYYMAQCLDRVGITDEALYYMGLVADDNSRFMKEYDEMLNKEVTPWDIMDYQFADSKKKPVLDCVTVGQILHNRYNVQPDNLLYAKALVNGAAKTVSLTGQQAWDFNLKDLCGDQPSLINIKYTRDCTETNSVIDKSKYLFNNTIVINAHKISTQDQLWRVDILIPNFNNFDVKRPDRDSYIPEFCSFIISNEKTEWNTKKLLDVYNQSINLISGGRNIEAMNGLKYVHSSLKKKYAGKKMSDADDELCGKSGYWFGYSLTELGNTVKGITYTQHNKQFLGLREREEYVNSLTALKDPRVLNVISKDLKDCNEYLASHSDAEKLEGYRNFLMRRQAYVLVEIGRLDEAEAILKEAQKLDKNPEKQQYYEGELKYIQQLRDKNKEE